MSPPPPRPDDPPPDRDPLLDDPLFAELVESQPSPELTVEPPAPPPTALPVAEPVDELPVARPVSVPRATPVAPPPRRPDPPPPTRRAEEPVEAPRPRWVAACGVLGCFGLGLFAALGFLAYAAVVLLGTLADFRQDQDHPGGPPRPEPVAPTSMPIPKGTIFLNGIVDAAGRAAGGRFLLLRVARTGEIVVFDPNTGQLARSFELRTPGVLFAGSASKLFVYRPLVTGDLVERWDLVSGKREATSSKPNGLVRADALATGAGVDGRVYLLSVPENGSASIRVLNPDTLAQEQIIPLAGWKGGRGKVHVRASDDGTLLGVTSAEGAMVVRLPESGRPTVQRLSGLNGKAPVLAYPAPDGRTVYSPGGVFNPETGRRKAFLDPYCFPTDAGSGLFLSLASDPDLHTLSEPLKLHLAANPSLSVEVPNVDVPRGLQAADAGDLPPDQRVHVWPAAGIAAVVAVPEKGGVQKLEVRKVDVSKLLQDLEFPHLVFGSEPRLWAVRGAEWHYRPEVWTKPGTRISFSLDNPHPAGMRFGPRNELTWTPRPGQQDADVVIRVEADGQTAEQRFRVAVIDADDADHGGGHDEDHE